MTTATKLTAKESLEVAAIGFELRKFIPRNQLSTITWLLKNSEEAHYYADKLREIYAITTNMPASYETDGQGDAAIVHLHYFGGSIDYWITEKSDAQNDGDAFGLASLGYEPELGYISLPEIMSSRLELDLHWTPTTIGEIKQKLTA